MKTVNSLQSFTNKPKRVVVAMSGGVDSSVAAALLREQGYDVIGISMQLWDYTEGERDRFGSCCSLDDLYDARRVADKLNIPFYVVNFEEAFSKAVVDYFVDGYLKGETPNPCLKCNQILKFEVLLKRALELDADFLATGHYSRVKYDEKRKRYLLLRGKDASKDQSYFLFTMTQKQLSKIIFPLGDLTKIDVRRLAQKYGLNVAEKKDSQEICFAPEDYPSFIAKYAGNRADNGSSYKLEPAGEIVDLNGNILGAHKGLYKYTIGQRKGLGVTRGEPLYVLKIDAKNNQLVVGPEDDLFSKGLIAKEAHWIGIPFPDSPLDVIARIRYRHKGIEAKVAPLDDNRVEVRFERPEKSVTPGQAVVFYKGDEVIGGGWIEK
ncbi:MAG: tRNA 2-thiouridine(34) synthase MnmA [Deltaproteobacteria bacterium RIFCSPLOWO2_12_FULL_43_16]|nr:MAG: tRNA 2-thiouridine(34) synthase MnmA [Deltaproteobacteria bacterium GWA2_43_19]OGQ10832.1 MAG: tRNA 2-thiouridine(34) synthase MnmA [Deltaproteobacteria bacterium RIFCSPHIGHO2_02_FULL_43_33]OGQ33940.1 MAG: tRNA 2-thiouridine(34) synthase MnmA [Deltaproteobacteria bacterium RIFCSPLOWO2_01_FULL_42_9]OGQ59915.1 MAG: tRNA 2-thiouridine(34) synthase MnmA [Deltaproteobacteria bacterium RIFCSPLOWO2_12_FULL_43_16]HBR16676.1 tRNA 2-thiouridine(34) synthase MnmA [Deltaproteobacteria bacterium]